MAGPAPGRSGSPTIAVPVVAKIPAPMVAPTPSAVRCHLLRERRKPPRSRMSFSQSCTDFRRKSWLIVPRSVNLPVRSASPARVAGASAQL